MYVKFPCFIYPAFIFVLWDDSPFGSLFSVTPLENFLILLNNVQSIFRKPKECKERHNILMDSTAADGADSAEDSGSSQPYPSTLPGIPKVMFFFLVIYFPLPLF